MDKGVCVCYSVHMANERTYRPEQLAEQLGVSGKIVRAYLRRTFTRPAEAKGSTWVVTGDQAKIVREHFLARRGK
jgi:hypothetical protein